MEPPPPPLGSLYPGGCAGEGAGDTAVGNSISGAGGGACWPPGLTRPRAGRPAEKSSLGPAADAEPHAWVRRRPGTKRPPREKVLGSGPGSQGHQQSWSRAWTLPRVRCSLSIPEAAGCSWAQAGERAVPRGSPGRLETTEMSPRTADPKATWQELSQGTGRQGWAGPSRRGGCTD